MGKRGPKPRNPMERFFAKIIIGEDTGCWDWCGAVDPKGYGRFGFVASKGGLAHRVAYELFVDPIPEGCEIDHLCRNRSCVNPDHLETIPIHAHKMRHKRDRERTHCPQGHPLIGDNLYVEKVGTHKCRICRNERQRRRTAKLREVN